MAHIWNPNLYMKNASYRLQPALDLLNRTYNISYTKLSSKVKPNGIENILDLGCGTGNITNYMNNIYPNAYIKGLDASNHMIETARNMNINTNTNTNMNANMNKNKNNISFDTFDISNVLINSNNINDVKDDASDNNDNNDNNDDNKKTQNKHKQQKYDIIYSNATLHWLENHHELLPKILHTFLHPKGGVFAFQIPDTRQQHSHLFMKQAFRNCRFENIKSIKNSTDHNDNDNINNINDIIDHIRIPSVEYNSDYYHRILSGCGQTQTQNQNQVQVDLGDRDGVNNGNNGNNSDNSYTDVSITVIDTEFDFKKYNIEIEHFYTTYIHQLPMSIHNKHTNSTDTTPSTTTTTNNNNNTNTTSKLSNTISTSKWLELYPEHPVCTFTKATGLMPIIDYLGGEVYI